MATFVPGPGLSLSSSRRFLTGATASPSRKHAKDEIIDTSIVNIKLPTLPKINLPKLPSIPLPGGKKNATPPPPPVKPKQPAEANVKVKVGGREVKLSDPIPVAGKPTESALASGIPKFYNPKTSRYEFSANAKGQNATPFDIRYGERGAKPTNRRINVQGTFRNMDPYTEELIWARPGWSSDEAAVAVRVALRNTLGGSNVFESELAELAASISCVTETANVKEFVRAIGLSSLYRKRFFEGTTNTRFVECNFKHFLGRAPRTQAEVSEHIRIINEEGYNAEINSYVDSDEYDTLFGDSRIPAVNFRGGHPYNNDMNKLAVLNGGYASSDAVPKKAFLVTGDATGFSPYGVEKGLPEAWRGENLARDLAGPVSSYSPDVFWNPQPIGLREAEIEWIGRMGTWTKYWYKDSIVYKDIMKVNRTHPEEEVEEAEAVLKYGSNMAKSYLGCRWAYDVAPVIEVRPPTSELAMNGQLAVKMQKISFPIPSDLQQKV